MFFLFLDAPQLTVEGQTASMPASLVTQQMSDVLQDQVLQIYFIHLIAQIEITITLAVFLAFPKI